MRLIFQIYFLADFGNANRSLLACGNAPEEGNVSISVVAPYCLAGTVAGSVFAVRTLLTWWRSFWRSALGDDRVGRFHGLWSLGSL